MRTPAALVATWLLVSALVIGCSGGDSADEPAAEPTPTVELQASASPTSTPQAGGLPQLTIQAANGTTARLRIEIADEPEEQATGLMNRTELAADAGMLFVFQRRAAGFYMKDTLIPLSVAFISECGRIVAIAHMEPQSLEVHNTSLEYRFGLEVNQGWFDRNGVGVGSQVTLPADLRSASCV